MDRAANKANAERMGSDWHAKGANEMPNPNLTKWLGIVWDALNEEDERKRDALLHAADSFLQSDNQDRGSALPFVETEITAA